METIWRMGNGDKWGSEIVELGRYFTASSSRSDLIHLRSLTTTSRDTGEMDLKKVVDVLHTVASPSLAGCWDNVGLLVEPSPPHIVQTVLLTNDLTPPVLEEAISLKSDLILSYHPPIFSPLKRLTQTSWKERVILQCVENRIAVFSPHTSYDCVEGGVNDWLLSCFDCDTVQPVEQHESQCSGYTKRVTVNLEPARVSAVRQALCQCPGVKLTPSTEQLGDKGAVCFACVPSNLRDALRLLKEQEVRTEDVEVVDLAKVPVLGYGMGRKGQLKKALTTEAAVQLVKNHLGLSHVRLASPPDVLEINSVAVCAGSGSSVLRNVKADLYVTGEMSHHDVLHAVYNGTSVILCDHSNTERGYLKVLQQKIRELTNDKVTIHVSQVDADPLSIV